MIIASTYSASTDQPSHSSIYPCLIYINFALLLLLHLHYYTTMPIQYSRAVVHRKIRNTKNITFYVYWSVVTDVCNARLPGVHIKLLYYTDRCLFYFVYYKLIKYIFIIPLNNSLILILIIIIV
jgi:hypothetical protein